MKLRTRVPKPIQGWGRRTSVAIGQPTAGRRITPDFILAGGQRCGTTSLFRALEQHPQLIRPTFHKGINYFDLNYHRGPRWYAAHFPLASVASRRLPAGTPSMAYEASGYYLFHPRAIERIARDLPDVKIVVMLRDPVERAYSAWKHETARGFETEDFCTALALEDDRLSGEASRMHQDPTYYSFSHRHHGYVARSDYFTQMTHLLEHFPRNQVHVIYSENFFSTPEGIFCNLADFLDVQPPPLIEYDKHNARPSSSMPVEARYMLRERLSNTYDELGTLVGSEPPWTRS